MNLAITNLTPSPASAAPAPAAPNDAPASVPAQGAVPAFAQWLDEMAAATGPDAGDTVDQGEATGETGHAPADAASADCNTQDADAATQDPAMLAALALPLMAVAAGPTPLAPPSSGGAAQPGARGQAAQAGVAQVAVRAMMGTPVAPAGSDPLAAVPGTLPLPAPAAQAAMAQASAGDGLDPAAAGGAAPASGEAARPAANAGERSATEQAAPAASPAIGAPASGWGIATPSPAQPATPATVALAGPPAAWRQTLQEALGDRLHMQVGNNFQQAVIRLEPPDLGRIDIAIRHSAGTLEVALTATHGEVVRQLHSVSDNLRNDLAGRQYAEVTVSVSQAPRAQQAGQSAFADQQGRQRQGGREQDDTPGLALADAGAATSTFSLNGRD